MTNEKKFNELLNDKDFVEEILNMDTIEDVQAGFAQHGVEISEDEVDKLGDIIEETSKKMSKLSEDELNQIAGGGHSVRMDIGKPEQLYVANPWLPSDGIDAKKGALLGVGITAGVAALAAGGYAAWKKWGHKK